MNGELIKRAMEADSAEELTEFAKENGIDLTEDAAKAIYDSVHMTGELEDGELDTVSGGGVPQYRIDLPFDNEIRSVLRVFGADHCYNGSFQEENGHYSEPRCKFCKYFTQYSPNTPLLYYCSADM